MDIRVRTLVDASIQMAAAIKLYSSAHDTKIIEKHFIRVRNEIINAAREGGITDRELKIIGVITKDATNLPRLRLREAGGLFINNWKSISLTDIKRYVKDNNLKAKRSTDKYGSFIYGFDKNKKIIFKYDQEEMTLYTDYTPIDFMNKKFA